MMEGTNLKERPIDSFTIDESMGQILRSTGFRDSMQLQTLLRYIVKESLKGNEDSLKERIIGIDVFGRRPDYDTADDPIVRARVGLLRKRLAHYYESEEAKNSVVQIVIPSGSYHPTFVIRPLANNGSKESRANDQPHTVVSDNKEDDPESVAVPTVPNSSKPPRWRACGIILVASCSLLLVAWVAVANWNQDEVYLLWKPIIEKKKTVLLYTGAVRPVYLHSQNNVNSTTTPGEQDLPSSAVSLSPEDGPSLTSGEFVPVRDGLVPPGDITADMKVAVLMNTYHRNLSLRTGSGLPFIDLQGSPTVLIGAFDNYWTVTLARDLPFFFDAGARIKERGGQHRYWSSVARADNTINEDYAVVFRLLDSKSGGPVIAIAGLTTCGTQAAAQFVTDPAQLKKVASIPRSALERKNLEFVLRTSLINCTPTSVDIVAQQYW